MMADHNKQIKKIERLNGDIMKIKTSMTDITRGYNKVWRCGYCDLAQIMHGVEPNYYNSGVYGWNCDIYDTPAGAITTGYRNMRGERIPFDIIEAYDKKDREIIATMWTDKDYRVKLEELRRDFF